MNLPDFGFVSVYREPVAHGVAHEAEWMERCGVTGRATAHLWRAPVGFVVPRRYTRLPGWAALRDTWTGEVQERASGGGLVPQGPGLWNLSLVWPAPSAMPVDIGGIYLALCDELAAAFARLGLVATPQEVIGSFCDGRYNLAVNGRCPIGSQRSRRTAPSLISSGRPCKMTSRIRSVSRSGSTVRPSSSSTISCSGSCAWRGRSSPVRSGSNHWARIALEAAIPKRNMTKRRYMMHHKPGRTRIRFIPNLSF